MNPAVCSEAVKDIVNRCKKMTPCVKIYWVPPRVKDASSVDHVCTNHSFHRYRYELSYPLCFEWIWRRLCQWDCLQHVVLCNVSFSSFFFSFPVFCFVRHFCLSLLNNFYCDILHLYNFVIPTIKFSNICKPEEGWYGQPKYCYEKTIHVVLISFAVVFGLLVFGS